MAGPAESVAHTSEHSNSLTAQGTSGRAGSAQLFHFHRFPYLPKEIRQKVFEACLPRRVFRYTYERIRSHPTKSTFDLSWKPTPLPCIAFVCKDAYEISKLFLREYRVDFTDCVSLQWNQYLYGTTRIRFDADLDTLWVNYSGLTSDDEPYDPQEEHDEFLEGLHDGPHALTMSPKVNVVLDMVYLVGPRIWHFSSQTLTRWLTARPYSDCLAQHSHCTVALASTEFSATGQEIRASGLFGMFGEEREVLINIKDTAKIDQYERYIESLAGDRSVRSEAYFPECTGHRCPMKDMVADRDGYDRCSMKDMGAGRYGSNERWIFYPGLHGHVYGEDRVPPTTDGVAGHDAASALHLIQQAWLEAHHCFEPDHDPLVPWTGHLQYRKWDDEHHVVKHWLSKLPEFSFVAMYMVREKRKA